MEGQVGEGISTSGDASDGVPPEASAEAPAAGTSDAAAAADGETAAPVDAIEVIPPPPPTPPDLASAPAADLAPGATALPSPPAPAFGMAPPRRRRSAARLWISIGLVAVLLLGIAGGAALYLNSSLSSTYSAERAVTDYFAAQSRADVDTMFANATYLRGDGSFSDQFTKLAVTNMMGVTQNTDVSGLKINSVKTVDSSTRAVDVSMTWGGQQFEQSYTVQKDPARVHYYFYNSWKVVIPYTTIQFTLPNQAAGVQLDGELIPPAAVSAGSIQAIQGFHNLTMTPNQFYDASTINVNGLSVHPVVPFPKTISANAKKLAAAAINQAFQNCDASKYTDCFGHTYSAPNDGFIWQWFVPGSGYVDYTRYVYNMVGDPTSGMSMAIAVEANKATASGACTTTLTLNGNKVYNLKGTWTADLTWSNGDFGTVVTDDCTSNRA